MSNGGALAFISTLIDYYVINLPFAILPGLSAMLYFLIGYYFRSHDFTLLHRVVSVICWIFSLVLVFVLNYLPKSLDMAICMYRLFPLDFIGAIGAVYLIHHFSRIVLTYKSVASPLVWLGQVSLAVLCMHQIEQWTHLCRTLFGTSGIILRMSVPILLTFICSKIPFTRFIFGIPK